MNAKNSLHQPLPLRKTSKVLSPLRSLSRSPKQQGSLVWPLALMKSGLQISESLCTNPIEWHIERITMDLEEHCCGQSDAKKCGAKIACYRRALATPLLPGLRSSQRLRIQSKYNFDSALATSLVVSLVLLANQSCTIQTFRRSGLSRLGPV